MTDREKLIELIGSTHYGKENGSLVSENFQLGFIEKIADHLIEGGVAVQKTGQWIDHLVRDWRCSECGERILKVRNVDGYCYDDKPNYCPNCGAKMDGGTDT